jgi:hypothetical protein
VDNSLFCILLVLHTSQSSAEWEVLQNEEREMMIVEGVMTMGRFEDEVSRVCR